MIDQLLREALNTRIVNRFLGYQNPAPGAVDKQVYALWNVLQKRKFRYSSCPTPVCPAMWFILSVYVRLMTHWSHQGSTVWTAVSCLLPCSVPSISKSILVRTPGHMFVGYYTDNSHKDMNLKQR